MPPNNNNKNDKNNNKLVINTKTTYSKTPVISRSSSKGDNDDDDHFKYNRNFNYNYSWKNIVSVYDGYIAFMNHLDKELSIENMLFIQENIQMKQVLFDTRETRPRSERRCW